MYPDVISQRESMMEEAHESLGAGEYSHAIKLGKQLEKLRFSSGFEIQALAYEGMGKLHKAVAVLEKGVSMAPSAWLLWQLLGNYYSDLREYDKSRQAYEKGLRLDSADHISLYYNYANLLKRWGKPSESLRVLQCALDHKAFQDADPDLIALCIALYIELCNHTRNYETANHTFEEFLRYPFDPKVGEAELSYVYSSHAETLTKMGQYDKALQTLHHAIGLHKHNRNAQAALRELRAGYSDYRNAKYMRITLKGQWHELLEGSGERLHFFTSYDVMADNETEAMQFIGEFEPEAVRNTLKIEHMKIIKSPIQPKGVYTTTGYSFFAAS